MKQLNEIIPSVVTSLQKTSDVTITKGAATRVEVAAIVMRTEKLKEIQISDQERDLLVDKLFEQGFSRQELEQRADSVLLKNTYKTIAFEYWVEDLVCSWSSRWAEVNRIINGRREEFMRKNQMLKERLPEEAAREGLITVQEWWGAELQKQIQKHSERIDKKCKRLRAQFYDLPEKSKEDLWEKAVARGLVKDNDPFKFLILPLLVPLMVAEFEEAIKANSVTGKQVANKNTT